MCLEQGTHLPTVQVERQGRGELLHGLASLTGPAFYQEAKSLQRLPVDSEHIFSHLEDLVPDNAPTHTDN